MSDPMLTPAERGRVPRKDYRKSRTRSLRVFRNSSRNGRSCPSCLAGWHAPLGCWTPTSHADPGELEHRWTGSAPEITSIVTVTATTANVENLLTPAAIVLIRGRHSMGEYWSTTIERVPSDSKNRRIIREIGGRPPGQSSNNGVMSLILAPRFGKLDVIRC